MVRSKSEANEREHFLKDKRDGYRIERLSEVDGLVRVLTVPFDELFSSKRAVLCRESQLLLRFFGEVSRQLNLIWASLTLQEPECIDPTFSRSRIKRRGQREKVASSNRLPRFQIRDCSARVRFQTEQFCGFLSSKTGL